MNLLFGNPELLRYARAQLRPGRLLTTAIACLALSATVAFVALHKDRYDLDGLRQAGAGLLRGSFLMQALALAAGGGIACLNSIFSEKEQNTFDYQRITRLTPLELTLGKLFGAPLLTYFICLCLTPLTIVAAFVAHAQLTFVLAAYVVLLVSSITCHAFCLLVSLLNVKGSQLSGIVLALVLVWFGAMDFSDGSFRIHSLGPFVAADLARESSWEATATSVRLHDGREYTYHREFSDTFWGHEVHHFPVLLVIDLSLAFWFLLAVLRNIKRDPQRYEAYSPLQFLGFILFLNLILVSFYDPRWGSLLDSQSMFLVLNLVIFFFLGVALLRNRESARRVLHASVNEPARWWNDVWPAPILGFGALLAGGLIVAALNYVPSGGPHANVGFALLRSFAFTLWMVSNLQLLQCLSLRPGKHPLVLGVLYLLIYYVCASSVLAAFGCFREPQNMPIGALFVPSALFLLDPGAWIEGPAVWVAGLVLQASLILLFFDIQSRMLRGLQAGPESAGAIPSQSLPV